MTHKTHLSWLQPKFGHESRRGSAPRLTDWLTDRQLQSDSDSDLINYYSCVCITDWMKWWSDISKPNYRIQSEFTLSNWMMFDEEREQKRNENCTYEVY
jgi:hypothetical protein